MTRCAGCAFTYEDVGVLEIPALLRAQPPPYAELLLEADTAGLARRRPAPEVWSPLEYTCHVRDVLQVQHDRLRLALATRRPTFASMRPDERAARDRYNDQEVTAVLQALDEAAQLLADAFEALDSNEWRRTGIYNYPTTAERTMAWLARHTLHEAIHHRYDIQRILDGFRPTARTTP